MPALTAARIRQLCIEIVAAKTEEKVNHLTAELRVALEEHIRWAKDSLTTQATALSLLDAENTSILPIEHNTTSKAAD